MPSESHQNRSQLDAELSLAKERSLRKKQTLDRIHAIVNNMIEERLIRISQRGRIKYFSWDEVFLSKKQVAYFLKVFGEAFAEDKGFVVALQEKADHVKELETRLGTLEMAYEGATFQLEEQDWYHKIVELEERLRVLQQLFKTRPKHPSKSADVTIWVLELDDWFERAEHVFNEVSLSDPVKDSLSKEPSVRKCTCPCGCISKPDGLEDLCLYCLEVHEDLRKEFVNTDSVVVSRKQVEDQIAKLVPQKQYYDFEVARIFEKLFDETFSVKRLKETPKP